MVRRLTLSFVALVACTMVAAWVGLAAPAHAAMLQTSGDALEQLLGQIGDNQVSRTMIMYGSLADLEQALGIKITSAEDVQKLSRSQQTAFLLDISGNQIYYSPFSGLNQPADWKRLYGIDPYQLQREAVVGTAPNWYALLQGTFQSGDIANALTALGYQSSPANGGTLYTLSNDNTPPTGENGAIAGSTYNRLIVSDSQIIAAPSSAMAQVGANANPPLSNNPVYSALVRTMESADLVPNTQLVSAGLFGGTFLSNEYLTVDPLTAALGEKLSAGDIDALRSKLNLQSETLIPQYETAGIGYRRGAKARYWVISLVYRDAGTAQSAQDILINRLNRYGSFTQSGRTLFKGWKINGQVTATPEGLQVVSVVMQLPSQTDVAWIELIADKDLGFLAVQR